LVSACGRVRAETSDIRFPRHFEPASVGIGQALDVESMAQAWELDPRWVGDAAL